MDVERFSDSPLGKIVPISAEQHGRTIDHYAFQPHPLPSFIELAPETYSTIEAAAMELGLLEGTAGRLERPYLITRPIIRREAVSTSALEGTFSTLEDLFAAELVEDVSTIRVNPGGCELRHGRRDRRRGASEETGVPQPGR